AVSVTDLFSTEMVNTGMFEVVERMQVAKILNEMGFQQTGVTDSSAAVEVGKMLNTKLVVIGTIGKLGQKLVLTAKIVEVEKGKILFAEKEMANGEDDLVGACEELANKLVFNITGVKIKNRKTSRVQGTSAAPAPQTTAQPAPAPQPAPAGTKADPKKKSDKKPVKEKDPVRKHSKEAMNELDDM
ncbi:MAG TPA: CsgG/HfaB family protein, partial [bacterium]|nr:CsgG/HfaB family protein [bacterium]